MTPAQLINLSKQLKDRPLVAAMKRVWRPSKSFQSTSSESVPLLVGEIATRVNCADFEGLRSPDLVESNAELADFDHIRTVETQKGEASSVYVQDELRTRNGEDGSYRILWVFDGLVELVTHGHGAEVFRGGAKIADMLFEANVPVSTKLYSEVASPGWNRAGLSPLDHNAQKSTIVLECKGSSIVIETRFKTQDFNYLDRGILASAEPWSRFVSSVALNYLFRPATTSAGRKVLVIAFSSVHEPGVFGYNYKAALDPIGANTLFILDDFGDQGAYYLMDHKDTSIFDAVQHLISDIVRDLGVARENIVTIGSSKGGTAAIFHGISAEVGHVYVGAPQTRIGTFVAKPHPNILRFMTGSTSGEAIEYLNRQLFEHVEKAQVLPRIGVVVGSEDHHYKRHALPLADHMNMLNLDLNLEVMPGVPHAKIGPEYRKRLLTYIKKVVAEATV